MRHIIELKDGWQFTNLDGQTSEVSIPHTWNAIDGQDGGDDYKRGTCTYTLALQKPEFDPDTQEVWIEFDGVNASAQVSLNGQDVCSHDGGYSTFRANLTGLLADENELVVKADNSKNDRVYPQMADFTFYGGIYRMVRLLVVNKAHFALDYLGSSGIRVTATPEGAGAKVRVQSRVTTGDVTVTLIDRKGRVVGTGTGLDTTIEMAKARRWHGVEDPYLYTARCEVTVDGSVTDRLEIPFGVRSFRVDEKHGFILNDEPYDLHGVSRHQDRKGIGNAITREMHDEDMALIREIGATTLRLAHYQHDQYFYDLCDRNGLIVWAEIPYISKHMPNGRENTISQMKELIIQNYNHPSIMFWGISNEILIGGISQELVERHHDLQKLCKELDPTRSTTIAHVSHTPTDGPMHHITDLESYNHYFGWYGGKIEDNGPWLDKFHAEHPDICLGVSEYGCEGIINWHSSTPQCKDYTEEYQAVYHEYMAQAFEDRPWIWASHVWNMFDFGCAARNNKGLVTIDRKTRKDSFYLYQAYWTKDPMVHINGRRYAQRAGETTEVKVYSNQDCVTLYLNGKEVGTQQAHRVFHFTVALAEGFNTLLAVAGSAKDCITLEKVEKEPACYTLPEFNERQEGVANWFKQMGSLDLESPMEFPEGYYNIKDSMAELAKNEEAFAIVAKAVKLVTNFDLKPGQGMWSMMSGMSPEHMSGMISTDLLGDKFLPSLNAQLIKIKK